MSFESVSAKNKCVICGHDSWCSYTHDESYLICRREQHQNAKVKFDTNGNEYYVYKLNEGAKNEQ